MNSVEMGGLGALRAAAEREGCLCFRRCIERS